jgi:hypothetical protein
MLSDRFTIGIEIAHSLFMYLHKVVVTVSRTELAPVVETGEGNL